MPDRGPARKARRDAVAAMLTRSMQEHDAERGDLASSVGVRDRKVSDWTVPHGKESPRLSDIAAFPPEVARDCLEWLASELGYRVSRMPDTQSVEDDRRLHTQLLRSSGELHAAHAESLADDRLDGDEIRALRPLAKRHLRVVRELNARLEEGDHVYGEPLRKAAGE